MTAVPVLAAAQTPRISLPVSVGQSVTVTSADGRTLSGKVRRLTPAAMEIEGDGAPTAIAVDDVRRIRVRDSVGDGVAKGLAVALPVALLRLAADNSWTVLGGGPYSVNKSGKDVIVPMATLVGAGMLIGGFIDSLRLTTIYERSDGGISVSVRPTAATTGLGVGLRLRW